MVVNARRFITVFLAVLIAVLVLGGFELAVRMSCVGSEAIVISQTTDARFAPFGSATTFFQLGTGDKVRVVDLKDDWRKVKRPDGKAGWVNASALGMI